MMTLDEGIDRLSAAMKNFVATGVHKVSDIVLFNLAIDVQEQSRAVRVLSSGDFARAGYVNARSALESAIDANYLVAEPLEYDQRGARARVFELFASERLQQRAGINAVKIAGSSDDVEKAVIADATLWEADAPGARKILLAEYEKFSRRPPGIGDHWSGLSRLDLYRSLAGTESERTEMAQMLDTIYGVLSHHAHPGPRTSQRSTSIDEHNVVVIAGKADDVKHARKAAMLATGLTLAALQRRAAF